MRFFKKMRFLPLGVNFMVFDFWDNGVFLFYPSWLYIWGKPILKKTYIEDHFFHTRIWIVFVISIHFSNLNWTEWQSWIDRNRKRENWHKLLFKMAYFPSYWHTIFGINNQIQALNLHSLFINNLSAEIQFIHMV